MSYLGFQFELAAFYLGLVAGTGILVHHLGELNLSGVAAAAASAYSSALIVVEYGVSPFVGICFGTLVGILLFVLFGVLTSQTVGSRLIFASVALHEVVIGGIMGFEVWRGGAMGIPGVPPVQLMSVGGVKVGPLTVAAPLCFLLLAWFWRSKFALVLHGIGGDRLVTASLGYHIQHYRLAAYCFAGAVLGLFGSMYSFLIGVVSPAAFSLDRMVLVLSMVLVAGRRTPHGTWLAVVLLVTFGEILRTMGGSQTLVGHLQQILFGTLLIAVVMAKRMARFRRGTSNVAE